MITKRDLILRGSYFWEKYNMLPTTWKQLTSLHVNQPCPWPGIFIHSYSWMHLCFATAKNSLLSITKWSINVHPDNGKYRLQLYNIMLQNEEVCGKTIYSSSEASGVNHIIHRSRRLR